MTEITTKQLKSFDLTDVQTKHPVAVAEWKEIWQERANFMNAAWNLDRAGMAKSSAATGKIQERIDRLPVADQIAVLALANRAEAEERAKGGFYTMQGRPPPFNRSALHSTEADLLNAAGIFSLHKAARSITPAEGTASLDGDAPLAMPVTARKLLNPKP